MSSHLGQQPFRIIKLTYMSFIRNQAVTGLPDISYRMRVSDVSLLVLLEATAAKPVQLGPVFQRFFDGITFGTSPVLHDICE